MMKRDDLTGLAMGGNKTRQLEFLMADVLRSGCDTIVCYAALQSNYCRQVAAAGAKLRIEPHLVLFPSVHNERQGNLLLDEVLGAKVHLLQAGGFAEAARAAREIADRMEADGRKPYFADLLGQAVPIVFPAYLLAAEELSRQCAALRVNPDWLVLTSGSGVTHASLALDCRLTGLKISVLGISIRRSEEEGTRAVLGWAEMGRKRYGIPERLEASDISYHDEYRGEGYAIPTEATLDAIRLVAETEGILLDPVYTGKAMAGLIGEIRKGTIGRHQTVIFLHTGGTPALFAYHQELRSSSPRRVA